MNKKIRWGVLSTARIAQEQLIPAMQRADNVELVAIAGRGSNVHQVAKALEIPVAYESYEELLANPTIDAVYIPLPNHLHKEWVFKAAEAGKHILCEKPIALTADEASKMVEVCKKYNVKFMEAFMYQLHPQHNRVKELISLGEIGEVKLITSSHSFFMDKRIDQFRLNKETGGGSLFDVGCYCIHAIRFITGAEPVKVHCMAVVDQESEVDISTFGTLQLDNGIHATFNCSFDMAGRNEYEVVGSLGTIKVPYAFRPDQNGGLGKVVIQQNGTTREENFPGDLYRIEVEHFSDAILTNKNAEVSGEFSVGNMQVIEACLQSIKTGEVVELIKV